MIEADNRCVCCGEPVPEGRLICQNCENRYDDRPCDGCRWYARFMGVCCNADSPYCADFSHRCDLYKAGEPLPGVANA